ncbi:hypothetical protein F1559_004264 [Cyanidiococcus yangmingshanensis]|uniref:Eukaryotic translation initiation factor 3 30 kDa subunit n=1 Tax=Cyanidiococcus yangmingshanensis TaxID=2690220 RepID=A0A7J7IP60_9RHOD|nr:hypothetical protein F1559_004264 [Cyanidiococcus yangmingshanensis]
MQSHSSIPVADSWEDDELEFDLNAGAAVDARFRQQQVQTKAPVQSKRSDTELDPTLAAKIAQRKQQEEEQLERQRAIQAELDALPEAARKLRLRKLAQDADLEHAKEWLDSSSALPTSANSTQSAAFSLDTAVPRTKAELDRFAQVLVDRLATIRRGAKTPRSYILFLKELLHGLFVTSDVLSLGEVSELAAYVQDTLKSEREQRERCGPVSSSTPAPSGGASAAGTAAHPALSKGAKKATIRVERGDEFAAFAVGGTRRGANAVPDLVHDDDEDFM